MKWRSRRSEMKPTIPKTKTPKSSRNRSFFMPFVARFCAQANRMKIEHNVAHNWVDNLSVPKINIFIA
jgi:hypothetical protein